MIHPPGPPARGLAASKGLTRIMSAEGFTVVLASSGQEFEIGPGESILEVLLANGVNAASYCREGECGTCVVKVLEGEPHHKDFVLSGEERASNSVMAICVSGSKSKRLVIDL
jgi:vanillate O-demethylase ferredoxin subunit